MKPFVNTFLGLLAACVAVDAAAAEKSRKAAKPDRTGASNASMRTQQRTGDALAEKTGRPTSPEKTPSKAEAPDELRNALEDAERRLDAEVERFSAALAKLRDAERAAERSGKAKSVATARKAIDRETSTHERTKSLLVAQRDEIRGKLGLGPAPEPKDRTTTARGGA